MGDFLSGSDSARDVENVAKSLGSAIGNVVGASIDSYQKAANGTSAGDPVSSSYFTRNFLKKLAHHNTFLSLFWCKLSRKKLCCLFILLAEQKS